MDVPPRGRLQLPLTPAQIGIYFDILSSPSIACAYNIGGFTELPGCIDVDILRRASKDLYAHHPSTRVQIRHDRGCVPCQEVLRHIDSDLPLLDLSAHDDPELAAHAWMNNDLQRPIDPHHAPLFRNALLKLGENRFFHYIVWHHLIVDGISIGLFRQQLAMRYTQYSRGEPPSALPPDPFEQNVATQLRLRLTPTYSLARKYWRDSYRSPPERVPLTPRAPVRTLASEALRSSIDIEHEDVLTLDALASRLQLSLPQLLIASAAVLVGRWTGRNRLALGIPVHGRTTQELRSLMAMTTNIVPAVFELNFTDTLEAALASLARQLEQALQHREYRYEDFKSEHSNHYGRQDPFSLTVNVLRWRVPLRFADIEATSHVLANGPIHDLCFHISDRVDRKALRVGVLGNPHMYSLWELEEIGGQFVDMLRFTASRTNCSLGELRLASGDSDADLQPVEPLPPLHEMFERVVRQRPHALAIRFLSEELTYSQLNDRANRVAIALTNSGVGLGDRVGVFLERSIDVPIGLLAILKCGAAYVPVDPDGLSARTRMMLEDASVALVVTHSHIHARFQSLETNIPALCIDSIAGPAGEPIHRELDPGSSAAYVLYTSGSTGQPKGVEVTHRNLASFLRAFDEILMLRPSDVVAWVTATTFDIAAVELFLPLVTGATSVGFPTSITNDGVALKKALHYNGINVLQATPATFELLVRANWRPQAGMKVICGGEALSQRLANVLTETAAAVWNAYGPTETTVWSTIYRLQHGAAPLIGKPLSNTQVHVLDEWDQPAPVGAVGELHIGGMGVAKGYWRRPDLTQERFVRFAHVGRGAVLYKTGDLVRTCGDGNLEYVGRKDFQIKLKGYRIEPAEIEAALGLLAGVTECVVTAKEYEGAQLLVAYIAGDVDPAAVRTHLSARLPPNMVPTAIVQLDRLPRLASGKIDRNALPALGQQHLTACEYVAPRTDLERAVCTIIMRTLRTPRVGLSDDFFALGGDSLSAMHVAMLIQERFEIVIGVEALLVAPVVADFTSTIERLRGTRLTG